MNKNPWKILNTPEGSDERAIKRAYAKALKALDPDDRNGFIALREAYEAALQEAYWRQAEAEEAAMADDGAADGSDWAAAYAEYTARDAPAEQYSDAANAWSALPETAEASATPEAHFIDACWESWLASNSEDELLALLRDQQQALQDRDLDTLLDYGDALLNWFYHTENYAPRAFSWAADAYDWHLSPNDWRMNALYERYLVIANPKVASYPALAQWDENWQQGFWARLVQAIHPLRRGEAEQDFQRFRRDSSGIEVAELPASLQALYHLGERSTFIHIMSFLPFLGIILFSSKLQAEADSGEATLWLLCGWLTYLLGAAIYETGKIAGWRLSRREWLIGLGCVGGLLAIVAIFSSPTEREASWLVVNLAAMLALYLAAVYWQRMVVRQWIGQFSRWKWWGHGLAGLALLVVWWQGYQSLQLGERNETVFLTFAGAAFAYVTLCHTVLPAQTRAQYASVLLSGAVLLPFFWLVLDKVPVNAQEGALYWVLRIYVITGIIAIWLTPVYRQWHYALPTLLGLAGFIAFIAGLPPAWLVTLQLGLWILLPLAILATPRFPRLGFALPQALRSFTQSILAIPVPLVFWHLGWYLAFAFSIGVVLYILWIDSELDNVSP